MLCNLPVAVRAVCVSLPIFVMMACGQSSFSQKDKRSGGTDQEQLAAEAKLDGCLSLGGGAYDNGGGDVVVVVPPSDGGKGYEPPPPPPGYEPYPQRPCQAPGQYPQQPCKSNCGKDDGYVPIDVGGPVQYPTQRPIDPGSCGKGGKYCDDGGPGQWPTQTIGGGKYDRGIVEKCLGAFRSNGYDTRGQWNIDVRQVKNVNVLSQGAVTDFGIDHTIVIIKNVSVLGRTHFQLLNPNALYCIENVSVLDEMFVDSCHTGNVVWGKDVNVLSAVQTRPVMCR